MPRLNLKDDSLESDAEPVDPESNPPAPPTLRDVDEGGRGVSPLLWIILGIIVVAGVVFALNQFNIIHLWGPKSEAVSEALPEPELGSTEESTGEDVTQEGEGVAPSTPIPEARQESPIMPPPTERQAESAVPASRQTAAALPPSGTGNYTIQVSSWETQAKANEEAAKLTAAGYPAYVAEGSVGEDVWFRVRVGHYESLAEARSALRQLSQITETEPWVDQN
jgi:cell division septation protein DedD